MTTEASTITGLLRAWGQGDRAALEQLTPLVYDQLRRQARAHMRHEGANHVLQSTALVHETYLRLAQADGANWHDRVHFFAVSARIMRRILIDAARERTAVKRGGRLQRADHSAAINLDAIAAPASDQASMFCALDDALTELARLDARRARVVELRFFGGLTVNEVATLMNVSPRTVAHDWTLARAWLMRELQG